MMQMNIPEFVVYGELEPFSESQLKSEVSNCVYYVVERHSLENGSMESLICTDSFEVADKYAQQMSEYASNVSGDVTPSAYFVVKPITFIRG